MSTTAWGKEADVIVAGFGSAGGVAAAVAHDAGARVLLLEKGRYPGGCSVLAGGAIKCVDDAAKGQQYLSALSGGRIEEELVRVFATGLAENEEFIRELARADGARIETAEHWHIYPYPGGESLYQVRVVDIPGFRGFPYVRGSRRTGQNMFKLVMDNVEVRGIETLTQAAARRLVTDPEGVVVGLEAAHRGRTLRIKARRGVVLATGGFEHGRWLLHQYLQGTPFYSMAPVTNTGDGILMAQKVGAALWHMWLLHGSYGFKFPEFPVAFRHSLPGRRTANRMPWIIVDRFGQRYMNEYHPASQDTNHRPMELFDPDLPGYPRIPSYLLFDEVGRKFCPIAKPMTIGEPHYEWSQDNSREIERGWVLRADTLRSLGEKLRETPENGDLMEPEILEGTVAQWNQHVEARRDPLQRPGATMMPLKTPPFYSVPVWPIITNTQGGPVHNAQQQVLDPFGQPIPHLYAVGELGSFFSHIYEMGGNLGECFFSGRIAGEAAAGEEPIL